MATETKTPARDDNAAVWTTPFGGFHIGDPITDPQQAIMDYLAPEYEDPETKKYVEELISLECGNFNSERATSSRTTTNGERVLFAHEDTSIGGCEVLNPLYQFSEDDDIVPPINFVDTAGNGMGRVYSDMYRDNMHVLWMTFGVPRYNNLGKFYRQAYNRRLIDVMTSGDSTLSHKIGTIIGQGVGLALSIPFLPFIGAAKAYDAISGAVWGNNINKYYELKPAMHNYYKVVNTILAALCVHMNLIPNQPSKENEDSEKGGEAPNDEQRDVQEKIRKQFPNFSDEEIKLIQGMGVSTEQVGKMPLVLEAGPDIIKILSERHRRRRDNRNYLEQEVEEIQSAAEMEEKLKEGTKDIEHRYPKLNEWREQLNKTAGIIDRATDGNATVANIKDEAQKAFDAIKNSAGQFADKVSDAWTNYMNANNELDDFIGTVTGENAFIGFRIEKGSSQEESISNSTGESGVASKLKSLAQGARTRQFDFAGGNLGLGPVDAVISAVDSLAGAFSSAIGLGGLTDMITKGSGYLDIPKVWQDSSFSKSYSFSIKLQSTYADELSIYQSIYIPLAMLMAASFPLGIGKNSYTAPFLVQAFSKGMFSVPLGVISSLSIRRGDSENGWTHGHLPTVVDVSMSIEDLSPMMYLSMTDKNLLEVFRANTAMQDYYATLSGISLQERSSARKHMLKKWRITRLIWAKNTFNMGMLVHKIGSGAALRRAYSLRGRHPRTGT